MGRIQKEGNKGSKANFITRTQAVKKLQVSLPEFRKLCILKGIYPREPSKAPKGKDKTYYFKKDILYLLHDPLLQKFRDHRVWKRKVKKAKDKKEWDKVHALKSNRPTYNLSHLVKERYPTFADALRDMDDALCTVALFALMPATQKIAASRVSRCSALMQHFRHYISITRSLHKTFVSIKGIYYQARISPENRVGASSSSSSEPDEATLIPVTWLEPFTFTQKITKDVDYKVMLSFLEFYEVQLGFILFKLYTNIGLKYPPPTTSLITSLSSQSSTTLPAEQPPSSTLRSSASSEPTTEKRSKKPPSTNTLQTDVIKTSNLFDDDDEEEEEDESKQRKTGENHQNQNENEIENNDENKDEEMDQNDREVFGSFAGIQERYIADKMANIFKPTLFWLSRETPVESLQFAIRCFGGKVAWEGGGAGDAGAPLQITEKDERITHFVTDRGVAGLPSFTSAAHVVSAREYVQPQYIYDCINARLLLPTTQYSPGHPLPPHLSPFVNDLKEGYIPEYRKTLDTLFFEKYNVLPASSSIDPKAVENIARQNELDSIQNLPDQKDANDDEDSESEEAVYARELEDEQKQKKKQQTNLSTNKPSKKRKRPTEQDIELEEQSEQKEVAAALLPKKKRRLLERIKHGQRLRENVIEKLQHKKEMIEEGKAHVSTDSTVVYNETTESTTPVQGENNNDNDSEEDE